MELKLLFLIPLVGFLSQLYFYAISRQGVEKQKVCRASGIALFSAGSVGLTNRDILSVSSGLIMMMFGIRLIANGLERLDKTIYADRYQSEVAVDKEGN